MSLEVWILILVQLISKPTDDNYLCKILSARTRISCISDMIATSSAKSRSLKMSRPSVRLTKPGAYRCSDNRCSDNRYSENRCSDNRYSDTRYSDSRVVGLGLSSVFGGHERKKLSAPSLKVVTLLFADNRCFDRCSSNLHSL